MPGAVPRTSTMALTNSTLSYGLMISNLGIDAAINADKGLALGVNCYDGKVTCSGVAEAFGLNYTSIAQIVK